MKLGELLIRDKFSNMEQVCEVLREEISPVAQNFLVLEDFPVVRFKREGEGYVFWIEMRASRVKPFGAKIS